MTVRVAQFEDIDRVCELAEKFHQYSSHRDMPFEPEGFRASAMAMIMDGAVFLSAEGFAGVTAIRLYFCPSHLCAVELFWYCPREGRALREAMEAWGRLRGCAWIQFSSLADEHEKALERIYRKSGARRVETNWLKRL